MPAPNKPAETKPQPAASNEQVTPPIQAAIEADARATIDAQKVRIKESKAIGKLEKHILTLSLFSIGHIEKMIQARKDALAKQ